MSFGYSDDFTVEAARQRAEVTRQHRTRLEDRVRRLELLTAVMGLAFICAIIVLASMIW